MNPDLNAVAVRVEAIRRLVELLCCRPSELQWSWEDDGTIVSVRVCANTADAKRIVGKRRNTLNALSDIGRILMFGLKRVIEFGTIESNSNPEENCRRTIIVPSSRWNPDPFIKVFSDILELSFRHSEVFVECTPVEPDACKLRAKFVEGAPAPEVVATLSKAFYTVFVPIGLRHGRLIHASIERTDREVLGANDAVGGASRPVHVSRPEQDQRRPSVPSQHRGQLGVGKMRVSRLGSASRAGSETRRRGE